MATSKERAPCLCTYPGQAKFWILLLLYYLLSVIFICSFFVCAGWVGRHRYGCKEVCTSTAATMLLMMKTVCTPLLMGQTKLLLGSHLFLRMTRSHLKGSSTRLECFVKWLHVCHVPNNLRQCLAYTFLSCMQFLVQIVWCYHTWSLHKCFLVLWIHTRLYKCDYCDSASVFYLTMYTSQRFAQELV